MKKAGVILVVGLCVALLGQPASAAVKKADKPWVVATDTVTVTATVDAIDYEKRTVNLAGPEGTAVTLKAGKKVRRFDEIRKGDKVTAEYLESVAVVVRRPDGKAPPGFVEEVVVTQRGRKPAGLVVAAVEMLATVEAVDQEKRTITFKGTSGTSRTVKVDERVKKLRFIQKGDQVMLRVTEALALSLKPAEKK